MMHTSVAAQPTPPHTAVAASISMYSMLTTSHVHLLTPNSKSALGYSQYCTVRPANFPVPPVCLHMFNNFPPPGACYVLLYAASQMKMYAHKTLSALNDAASQYATVLHCACRAGLCTCSRVGAAGLQCTVPCLLLRVLSCDSAMLIRRFSA